MIMEFVKSFTIVVGIFGAIVITIVCIIPSPREYEFDEDEDEDPL